MASKQAMRFGDGLATASSSLPSAMAGGGWGNGVWAREGARGSFYRRQGEGGRTGEGAAGAGREARGGRGLGAWRGSHPRGARRKGGGCVASSCGARKEWVCETGGAGGWFGQGEAKWPGQVAAPAYGAAVGTVQEDGGGRNGQWQFRK